MKERLPPSYMLRPALTAAGRWSRIRVLFDVLSESDMMLLWLYAGGGSLGIVTFFSGEQEFWNGD